MNRNTIHTTLLAALHLLRNIDWVTGTKKVNQTILFRIESSSQHRHIAINNYNLLQHSSGLCLRAALPRSTYPYYVQRRIACSPIHTAGIWIGNSWLLKPTNTLLSTRYASLVTANLTRKSKLPHRRMYLYFYKDTKAQGKSYLRNRQH